MLLAQKEATDWGSGTKDTQYLMHLDQEYMGWLWEGVGPFLPLRTEKEDNV